MSRPKAAIRLAGCISCANRAARCWNTKAISTGRVATPDA